MARARTRRAAAVGVAEHGSASMLVTVVPGGELLDRGRIDLTDPGAVLGREDVNELHYAMGRAIGPLRRWPRVSSRAVSFLTR